MKLKYLMMAGALSLSISVVAQETKEPVVENKEVTAQLPVSKLDPEQVKQQKLENLIRAIINRCDPFPKCL